MRYKTSVLNDMQSKLKLKEDLDSILLNMKERQLEP